MRERDVVVRVEEASNVLEGVDEIEEGFRAQQTMILVRVAHVPVGGGDQARHGLEGLRGFVGIGHWLVRKVTHFDPCGSRVSMRFSGGGSIWLMSHAISVGTGEVGWGQ